MRLLYFSRDYTTHDHRILTALSKTEHQVYYLRLEQRGHALEDRALPPQVEIVHWKGGKAPATFKDGLWLWQDLKNVIHKIRPDVLQAATDTAPCIPGGIGGFSSPDQHVMGL